MSSTATRSYPCSSTSWTNASSIAALVRATRRCTREPGREGGISVSLRRDVAGFVGSVNLLWPQWSTHRRPVCGPSPFRRIDKYQTLCMVLSQAQQGGAGDETTAQSQPRHQDRQSRLRRPTERAMRQRPVPLRPVAQRLAAKAFYRQERLQADLAVPSRSWAGPIGMCPCLLAICPDRDRYGGHLYSGEAVCDVTVIELSCLAGWVRPPAKYSKTSASNS